MDKHDEAGILAGKLADIFFDPGVRARAAHLPETYGTEECEKEPDRVRLAVLKPAGDDLTKVQGYPQNAREDYRDVLAWADFPNQNRIDAGWGAPRGKSSSDGTASSTSVGCSAG